MLHDKQKVSKIMKLRIEISDIKDVDVLLERILREARKIVNTDPVPFI